MTKNKMAFGKAQTEILKELCQQYKKIDTSKQYKFFCSVKNRISNQSYVTKHGLKIERSKAKNA
jgi:hypothetical protein